MKRKIPSCFLQESEKRNHLKYSRTFCSSDKTSNYPEPTLLGFYQSLTYLVEEKYSTPVHSSHPAPPEVKGKNLRNTGEVHSLGHRLTNRLRTNHRNTECFPSPAPHHYITKGLCTIVPFIQYIRSTLQQKITGHTIKRQKKKRNLKRLNKQ